MADPEELGGAKMHAEISGTVDFHEPDDGACLTRLRSLMALLPPDDTPVTDMTIPSGAPAEQVYDLVSADGRQEYDMRDLLASIVDKDSLQESKAHFGQSLVTCYARLGGRPLGIVANQRQRTQTAQGRIEIGGVIYSESADKAARFVLDCNQTHTPLLFVQDVVGFMVGKEADSPALSGAELSW